MERSQKPEDMQKRRQETEDRRPKERSAPPLPFRILRSSVFGLRSSALLLSTFYLLLSSSSLASPPSQDDVFKSIQQSVGERTEFDSRPVLLLAVGGVVVLLVLAVSKRRQQKASAPKAVNHSGRLMKEVLRELPLKPAEMKQLKTLADGIADESGESPNPLTLLICPSLLLKGLQADTSKVDRKAIAQVVRKMKAAE